MKIFFAFLCLVVQGTLYSQSPILISPNGKYLGNLNDNPYDPNSVANPYGRYGSEYSLDSVNNPDSRYGSEYSLESPNNPDATTGAPRIYGADGRYLGRLSKNDYDLDSASNPDGKYGSEYSLESINNPSSKYGSEYSRESATYLYGKRFFENSETNETQNRPNDFFSIDDPGNLNLNQNTSLSQMVVDLKRINARLKRTKDKDEIIFKERSLNNLDDLNEIHSAIEGSIKTESDIKTFHSGNAYLLNYGTFDQLEYFWRYNKDKFKLTRDCINHISGTTDVFCDVCNLIGNSLPLAKFSDKDVYATIKRQSEASKEKKGLEILQPCQSREKQIMPCEPGNPGEPCNPAPVEPRKTSMFQSFLPRTQNLPCYKPRKK
jgi:hypothetical protein